MRLWRPPPGEAQLHEWWLPLIAVSRRARTERIPWPVHVDEFALEGRVDRRGRPSVWVYVHGESLEELLADAEGRTYEFVHHRSGGSPGRFQELELRRAVRRARLPDHVEPIWYEEPRSRHELDDELDDEDDDGLDWPFAGRRGGAGRAGRLRLVVSNGP